MPLRDHFRPPLDKKTAWEGFHGAWPAVIVMGLNRQLPPRYLAEPRVHLGVSMEIDVSAYDEELPDASAPGYGAEERGVAVATAMWAPPLPTFTVAADLPDQDGYEVRVFDTWRDRRLVAAVEIVSPGNKDRPENRRALRDQVCGPAPAAGLGRDRRPGHDPAVQPVRRPARSDRPDGPRAGA